MREFLCFVLATPPLFPWFACTVIHGLTYCGNLMPTGHGWPLGADVEIPCELPLFSTGVDGESETMAPKNTPRI